MPYRRTTLQALVLTILCAALPASSLAQQGARPQQPTRVFAAPTHDSAIVTTIAPRPGCASEYVVIEALASETAATDAPPASPVVQWYLVNVSEFAAGWVRAESVRIMPTYTRPVCGTVTGDKKIEGSSRAKARQRRLLAKLHLLSQRLGQPLHLNAMYRSPREQAVLYASFLAGHGAPANPPGKSEHEQGRAADVEIGTPRQTKDANLSLGRNPKARRIARQLGLVFPHSNEPWHVELA